MPNFEKSDMAMYGFLIMVVFGIMLIPSIHAESSVSIIMEKTTYTYCEKLFYVIEVSEVTGNPAIIHIRDDSGKGSSAIPILISEKQNPVPSLIPFEKGIFPIGKYFIDVEYNGQTTTAEFELIDSNKKCIGGALKPIMTNWLSGNISDGFLIDAIQKFVDDEIILIPFEIDEANVYNIDIPEWVKNVGSWWLQDYINDDEFANVFNYLIEKEIISDQIQNDDEI